MASPRFPSRPKVQPAKSRPQTDRGASTETRPTEPSPTEPSPTEAQQKEARQKEARQNNAGEEDALRDFPQKGKKPQRNRSVAKKGHYKASAKNADPTLDLDSEQGLENRADLSVDAFAQTRGPKNAGVVDVLQPPNAHALLPHSASALLHRLKTPNTPQRTTRNLVNDLAAFSATPMGSSLEDFGNDLNDLVEKVEAGAYRNRDLRIPLSQLEFPRDKDLFELFQASSMTSHIKERGQTQQGALRHALLDLMDRLSQHAPDAVIFPSWPVRVQELGSLWQLQSAMINDDNDGIKKWATQLLQAAPKGCFSAFATSMLDEGDPKRYQVEAAATAKALAKGGDVDKLCCGIWALAQRTVVAKNNSSNSLSRGKSTALSTAELQEELSKLPEPDALDTAALWTPKGESARQEFQEGLHILAAHHPDVEIFAGQTLKEASMYSKLLDAQFDVVEGRGNKANLVEVTQAFVEAFPDSERSLWATQILNDDA